MRLSCNGSLSRPPAGIFHDCSPLRSPNSVLFRIREITFVSRVTSIPACNSPECGFSTSDALTTDDASCHGETDGVHRCIVALRRCVQRMHTRGSGVYVCGARRCASPHARQRECTRAYANRLAVRSRIPATTAGKKSGRNALRSRGRKQTSSPRKRRLAGAAIRCSDGEIVELNGHTGFDLKFALRACVSPIVEFQFQLR